MKKITLLIAVFFTATLAYSQQATDNFDRSYDVSNYESIRIHNYNGNVTVTSKPGNKLELKVKRILKAKTSQKRLNWFDFIN